MITGAAKGLGQAFARRLGAAGFKIVACDIDPAIDELDGSDPFAQMSPSRKMFGESSTQHSKSMAESMC